MRQYATVGLLSDADAYRYLPESVRKFPAAPELAAKMRSAGFRDVSFEHLTGGSVALTRDGAVRYWVFVGPGGEDGDEVVYASVESVRKPWWRKIGA